MYCRSCGAVIYEESKFCTKCGAVVNTGSESSEEAHRPSTQYNISPAEYAPAWYYSNNTPVKPKKLSTKNKILIIASAAVILVCAILIFVFLEAANADRYASAAALMDSDPLQAKALFDELGDYKDSSDLSLECLNIYDYDIAKGLMESGDYAQAYDAFAALRDYKDSEYLSLECRRIYDFNMAKSMMDSGDYAGAYDSFIALGDYKNAPSLAADCKKGMDYAKAEEYWDAGKYYSAYVIFDKLDDYSDAANRAENCIQAFPPRVNFINQDYDYDGYLAKVVSTDCIGVYAPKDGFYTFITVYDVSLNSNNADPNSRIAEFFISPGADVGIYLPGDRTYTVKVAYGTNWFGTEEMFGDDGTYGIIQFKLSGDYKDSIYLPSEPNTSYQYSANSRPSDNTGYSKFVVINREDF